MKQQMQVLAVCLLAALVACDGKSEKGEPLADLFTAAQMGRVDEIERLASQTKSIDEMNSDGYSPLMLAVRNGHLPAVRALVAKGANVHVKHASGANLLMIAAGVPKGPTVPVIEFLLQRGLDPNELDQHGRGALEVAVDQKDEQAVKRLIAAGAKSTQRVIDLVKAADYPNREIVREVMTRTKTAQS